MLPAPTISVTQAAPDTLEVDRLLLPVDFEQPELERLARTLIPYGQDARQVRDAVKSSAQGRCQILPVDEASLPILEVVEVGCDPSAIRRRFQRWSHARPGGLKSLGLDVTCWASDEDAPRFRAAVEGLLLGLYRIGHRQTEGSLIGSDAATPLEHIVLPLTESQAATASTLLELAQETATAQLRAIELVNTPTNLLGPAEFARIAVERSRESGYQVNILDADDLAGLGLNGILAVARSSARSPLMLLLDYQPSDVLDPPQVGLVGKGVTFDSGGLTIKSAANMRFMKADMAGAAAVLCAVDAAARLGLPLRVTAAIPCTDNMPGPAALAPGEVYRAFNGLNVEVVDADAEGRLILADALSYLTERHSPHLLVDLATLTGSCKAALGTQAAAFMTCNDELALAIEGAGHRSGELCWRLPLWEAYDRLIRSDVADLKNYGGPEAGAISAGRFLKHFTGDHAAWAHIDIAAMSFAETEMSIERSATGYGVRLILQLLEDLGRHPGYAEGLSGKG